jgi:hypothetical protein
MITLNARLVCAGGILTTAARCWPDFPRIPAKCLNLAPQFEGDYLSVKLICFVFEARIQAELAATLDRNTHTDRAKAGSLATLFPVDPKELPDFPFCESGPLQSLLSEIDYVLFLRLFKQPVNTQRKIAFS